MNVLIIDDDIDDTELFCKALSELFPSAKCVAVNSCQQINAIVREANPDIIFMDGHMFPTSGKECLKQLHEVIDQTQTKVIIHSGSLSPKEMSEFEAMGVDDILIKPGSYLTLKNNIFNVLAKYNLASHL